MSGQKNRTNNLVVNFDNLPFTANLSESGHSIVYFALSGVALMVVAILASAHILGIVAAIFLGRAIFLVTKVHTIIFHQDHVTIITQSLFESKDSQNIPYDEFKGIVMGQKMVRYGRRSFRVHQTITMIHKRDSFNAPLYDQPGHTPPRDIWKDYITHLKIPGLEWDSFEYKTISSDKITLTLQQRHGLSPINSIKTDDHDLSLKSPPPPMNKKNIPYKLEILDSKNDTSTTIRINGNRLNWLGKLFVLSISLLLIVLPFYSDMSYFIIFIEILIASWVAIIIVLDLTVPRELMIHKDKVELDDVWPLVKNDRSVKKLDFAEVESIRIEGSNDLNKGIVIHGKTGDIHIGQGLNKTALKWLQDYLRAAVVSA